MYPGLLSCHDYLLYGDENGDLSLRDLYTMNEITSLPLQLPIQTISLTQANTHILAPLRDGKVIVIGLVLAIGAKFKPRSKTASISASRPKR